MAGVSQPSTPRACAAITLFYSPAMATTAASIPTGFRRIFAWPRVRFTLVVSAVFGVLMGLARERRCPSIVLRAVMVGSVILFDLRLARAVAAAIAEMAAAHRAAAHRHRAGRYRLPAGSRRPSPADGDRARLWPADRRRAAVRAVDRHRHHPAATRRVRARAGAGVRTASAANSSAASRMRACGCCRRRSSRTSCSIRSPTCRRWWTRARRRPRRCSPASSPIYARPCRACSRRRPRSQSEVELVRAYLELMQMRMPDRLQYAIHLDPAAARLHCPPMTLLTLVENAVRHGIDPSETGGRIDADIWLRDGRCVMRVTDTGVGLKTKTPRPRHRTIDPARAAAAGIRRRCAASR